MKNIALIGCGRISNRHIDAIAASENAQIVAVCDIIPERAQACAERVGGNLLIVSDFRELNGQGIDVAA